MLPLIWVLAAFAASGAQAPEARKVKAPLDETHTSEKQSPRVVVNELTRDFGQQVGKVAPGAIARRNYIDEHIFGKMDRDRVPHAGLATDAEFLRRVHLDLTGLLPDPDVIRRFLEDSDPGKREKMVDSLLSLSPDEIAYKRTTPFIDKWTYYFGDLFRITHEFPGNSGMSQYVHDALMQNVPYDTMARELITAQGRSSVSNTMLHLLVRDAVFQQGGVGKLGGLNSQTINHEDTCDNISINVSRIFLGVNLECISCHAGRKDLENS